jgi:hypothetical protein
VGSEARIVGLVKFLCAEMAAAFAAAGRSVPPWRAEVQLYATTTCPHGQQIHIFSQIMVTIRRGT